MTEKVFEEIVIKQVNNGFVLVVVKERELEKGEAPPIPRVLGGPGLYEETTNVFHCLRDVANFIGNLSVQAELRK
jgi:hypothetical protein